MAKSIYSTMQAIAPVFKRFVVFARDDQWYFIWVAVAILGVTLTNTILIWLLGQPVNLLQSGQYDQLYAAMAVLVGVLLINQALQFVSRVASNWLGLRFVERLRTTMVRNLAELSFPVAGRFQKGDLLARISNDVDQVEDLIVDVPLGLISHFFTISLYTIMILWIDVGLAMVALIFLPIFYLHQRFFAPRKGNAARKFYHKNGKLLGFEDQILANFRGISSYGIEPLMGRRHVTFYNTARHWAMKMRIIDSAYDTSFNLITYICGVVIVIIGITSIKDGALQIGHLVSFLLYLGYISVPVRGFAQAPIQWQGDLGAAHRIQEILDLSASIVQSPKAQTLQVSSGTIEFRKLLFRYKKTVIFNNVNFSIRGGETLALVGPSGSGKTTLVRLLLRFYDAQSGQILIDDTDISQCSLNSLRLNIAVVWQDPFLMSGTIADNLRLAKPDATDEEIVQACKASYAWEFIQELEMGVMTHIGEGAISLSVGQCQRLSIAQAFLRDAPILVLDEASSALDSHSEQRISHAINILRSDRTTLIIAHRYSSIRLADRVLYLNGDGSITINTHEELLANHPDYHSAVEWQTSSK